MVQHACVVVSFIQDHFLNFGFSGLCKHCRHSLKTGLLCLERKHNEQNTSSVALWYDTERVLIHGGPAIFQTVSRWLRDKRLRLWENRDEITGCWAIIKPQIYEQVNQPWNYMLDEFTSQNHDMHCRIKKNSVFSICASLLLHKKPKGLLAWSPYYYYLFKK